MYMLKTYVKRSPYTSYCYNKNFLASNMEIKKKISSLSTKDSKILKCLEGSCYCQASIITRVKHCLFDTALTLRTGWTLCLWCFP